MPDGIMGYTLSYVTCIDMARVGSAMSHMPGNAGHWSCALAHWNRTAEYISTDEESTDKESRRIKFSSPGALDEARRVEENKPHVM